MKRRGNNGIRKIFILLIMLIVCGGVVYNLFFQGKETATSQPASQPQEEQKPQLQQEQQSAGTAIKAVTVAQFDFQDFLNALGSVKGGLEFKLSFEVPGIIDSINYQEGEKYLKGSLLMSLKQDDMMLRMRRSEARLKKAQANEKLFKQKLDAQKKLYEIGAIPETTLDKFRLEYEQTQYEREEAELQVRADEVILEKSNLYAPSSGMIGELNVEEGEAITSNTLLGTHILIEYVKAEFGVIERDVTRISKGQKAFIYVDAYPGKVFNGEVDRVSPIVTGTSRTATADVKIDNAEGLLLPGSFARIKILLYEKQNAIVIPTEAVIDFQGDKGVYIVDEESSTVDVRLITVDYSQPDYTIVSSGLKAGDLIAISGLNELESGGKVEVLEKQQLQ